MHPFQLRSAMLNPREPSDRNLSPDKSFPFREEQGWGGSLFEILRASLFLPRDPIRRQVHEQAELIQGLRGEEGDEYFLRCEGGGDPRAMVSEEALLIGSILLKRFGDYGVGQLKCCHGVLDSEAFRDMHRVGALEKLTFAQIDFIARRYGTLPFHPELKDAGGSPVGQTCIETTVILAGLGRDNWRVVTRHPSVPYTPPDPKAMKATERELFRKAPRVAPYAPASSPQVVLALLESLTPLGYQIHESGFLNVSNLIDRGKLAIGDVLLFECADPAFGGSREAQLAHDREFHKWKIVETALSKEVSCERAEVWLRDTSRYSVSLKELNQVWRDAMKDAIKEIRYARDREGREALRTLAYERLQEMKEDYLAKRSPDDKKPNFHVSMVVGFLEGEPQLADVSAGRPKTPFRITPLRESVLEESFCILYRSPKR